VPPSLFREPLLNGPAAVVAANVVIGPAPTPGEYGSMLSPRGIRGVVYVADRAPAREDLDQSFAEAAGLSWQWVPADVDRVIALAAQGGPWYVYGPAARTLAPAIAERLGPPLGTR
jgi:hypothetical protein